MKIDVDTVFLEDPGRPDPCFQTSSSREKRKGSLDPKAEHPGTGLTGQVISEEGDRTGPYSAPSPAEYYGALSRLKRRGRRDCLPDRV